MSCRSKKRQSELRLVLIRLLRSSTSVSSKVRSGCSATTAKILDANTSSGETLPPRGFGAALLSLSQRCSHFTADATLTSKHSAASWRDAPASTASKAKRLLGKKPKRRKPTPRRKPKPPGPTNPLRKADGSNVRAAAFRSRCLSLAKTCSMGRPRQAPSGLRLTRMRQLLRKLRLQTNLKSSCFRPGSMLGPGRHRLRVRRERSSCGYGQRHVGYTFDLCYDGWRRSLVRRDATPMPESHPAACRRSAQRCRRRAEAAQDAASKAILVFRC